MPQEGITNYNLLISCPGDIPSEYLDKVSEVLTMFNALLRKTHKISFTTVHWFKNSYPQAGDKPQPILNKQIVDDCDIAVAFFWTRFGTPTDTYGSGTEEEISKMVSEKKQVFTYFLDIPIPPSQQNPEQYAKVRTFKEEYKGIYSEIKTTDDFKIEFSRHFINFLSDFLTIKDRKSPSLKIRDIDISLKESSYAFYQFYLSNSKFLKDKNADIDK
jgi:hypothetical protein